MTHTTAGYSRRRWGGEKGRYGIDPILLLLFPRNPPCHTRAPLAPPTCILNPAALHCLQCVSFLLIPITTRRRVGLLTAHYSLLTTHRCHSPALHCKSITSTSLVSNCKLSIWPLLFLLMLTLLSFIALPFPHCPATASQSWYQSNNQCLHFIQNDAFTWRLNKHLWSINWSCQPRPVL